MYVVELKNRDIKIEHKKDQLLGVGLFSCSCSY